MLFQIVYLNICSSILCITEYLPFNTLRFKIIIKFNKIWVSELTPFYTYWIMLHDFHVKSNPHNNISVAHIALEDNETYGI